MRESGLIESSYSPQLRFHDRSDPIFAIPGPMSLNLSLGDAEC